jgi:class 3 adenylate cyclase/HAMP domain-containing protein
MQGSADKFTISFSLRLKITLTFLIIGGLVGGFLSFSMYEVLNRRLFVELQNRLSDLAKVGSRTIDREALGRLVQRLAPDLSEEKITVEEQSADYASVSASLNGIREVEPRLVRYVYIYYPTADANTALYVVDADVLADDAKRAAGDTSVGDISHFASVFDMSGFPVAREVITVKTPMTEKSYSWDPNFKVNSLSGYAPILGADGKTLLGVLGIDMVDTDVRAVLRNALTMALVVITAALALTVASSVILGSLFTRGIISLDKIVRRFDKSNLDVRAEVRTRDEVGRLGHSFNAMAGTIQGYSLQLESLLSAYGRFVPREFLTLLNKGSILDVKLGDQTQREMTVLFSDIRNFTMLSEAMTPLENFNFLNSYLRRMGPKIRANGGFIDKYIGDAIMGLFPGKPDDALRAAVAMHAEMAEYNMHRRNSGYLPISIGIGVNTGRLMLGTLGEQERMDGSVISDAVNLSSRLEGLTRMYGITILTTGETVRKLSGQGEFHFRFIDRVRVKGRRETVLLFEVLDGNSAEQRARKLGYRSEFARALKHYFGRRFSEALEIVTRLRKGNPEDEVLGIYEKRSRLLAELGAPEGWQGIELIEVK